MIEGAKGVMAKMEKIVQEKEEEGDMEIEFPEDPTSQEEDMG
jgi:hypothetical protein